MLIFALIRLFIRGRQSRRGERRFRDKGQVPLECPMCKSIGLALELVEEVGTGSVSGPAWPGSVARARWKTRRSSIAAASVGTMDELPLYSPKLLGDEGVAAYPIPPGAPPDPPWR